MELTTDIPTHCRPTALWAVMRRVPIVAILRQGLRSIKVLGWSTRLISQARGLTQTRRHALE